MKLNAVDKYKDLNKKILDHLITVGWSVDRFGHAEKVIDGLVWRYLFQQHHILKQRREMDENHPLSDKKFTMAYWIAEDVIYYKSKKIIHE